MQPETIQKILVVGGGSAGFLSAVCFKKTLPELEVTLVHSPDIPVIGVGESTTGYVPDFLHGHLQIDESEFIRETRSSLKLGIKLLWGDPAVSHFNYTFDGGPGVQVPGMRKWSAFHMLDDPSDASYFAAFMDRDLAPCVPQPGGDFLFRRGWAYHIDNALFLAYLERLSKSLGVKVISGEVSDVRQKESGEVSELQLRDGRSISADLYVDCTGFRSLLLGETLGERYVGYDDTLWCDTAIIGSWRRDGRIRPYTTAETMEHGWCWQIEFYDRVTRGYVFSSQSCSEDEAAEEMKRKNPSLGDDLRTIKFPRGRYENFWVKNVVAVGNSCGFVEPLEATALHLLAFQLWAVANTLRETGSHRVAEIRKIHNTRVRNKWDDVRDFLAVHYKFNHHSDSAFWQACRNEISLHGAEELVDFYREAGPSRLCEMFVSRDSTFGILGYLAMLLGQRVPTKNRGDLMPVERRAWLQYRETIRRNVKSAVDMRKALDTLYSGRTTLT